MNLLESIGFEDLNSEALEAYASEKAIEIGLTVPAAYIPIVLENLAALQTHAAILKARLEAEASPSLLTTAP